MSKKHNLNREQEAIVLGAWEMFSKWCREHDPDGEMGVIEAINAYSDWCNQQTAALSGDTSK